MVNKMLANICDVHQWRLANVDIADCGGLQLGDLKCLAKNE